MTQRDPVLDDLQDLLRRVDEDQGDEPARDEYPEGEWSIRQPVADESSESASFKRDEASSMAKRSASGAP